LFLLAVACGSDERTPEELLRDDLEGLEAAFNEQDVSRIYDAYMALDCRDRLTADQAEERFDQQASEARLAIEDPLRVEIEGSSADVRVAMSASAEDRNKEAVETITLVFEDGHWRFQDCFGAQET